MKSTTRIFIALYSLVVTSSAFGASLIDTGQPDTSLQSGGYLVNQQQYLAGRMDLSQSSTITGIEAFMHDGYVGGTATIALYPDTATDIWGLPVPDAGLEIFSQAITITALNLFETNLGWQGASGLDWNLGAGSYWIAFEVRAGQTYDGSFPTLGIVPNPLADYALWNESNNVWFNDSLTSHKWGLRVYGEPASPVPLPASAWFFLSGLGMLAGSVRRKIRLPAA